MCHWAWSASHCCCCWTVRQVCYLGPIFGSVLTGGMGQVPAETEKLAMARLQREVSRCQSEGAMREKLILELEEERRLRLESEKRLREVTHDSELGRAQMVSLQQQFSR
ncbi:Nck-associated protein 5 [Takifugu flavidus]|uniref:Nck-associated protein 5 n=1 Tax=Takifugu flavidus TaxID=433684 RepID=A0A5C6NAA6_9TELE|nr:Nck-associated protein 5 [Takifugu flavidus]